MTTITCTPSAHRTAAGLFATLAVALLSGCGGGAGSSTGPMPVVTMTASPPPPGPTAARRANIVKSDVVGRKFDLGTITSVEDDGGTTVVTFDRWTARGVADSTVAAKGTPIRVHDDEPYRNLNSQITYRIPVAQGAVFTYRHCVAIGQPPVQKSSTLEDFTRLPNPEKVILLTLDQHGRVFSAQNDPAC